MATHRTRRRRTRRAVALAVGLGGLAAAGRQAARRSWASGDDPCGPDGLTLPEGEDRTVTVDDGAELAARLAGPVDGPVVVLPHCWTGSRAIWAPVARILVSSGHRVVLYDQRGHGASTFGAGRTDMERLGADLREVLEQLDLHDVVLAGHSMGGMTVQALAKEDPDVVRKRARGVVLVSTSAKVMPRPVPSSAVQVAVGARAIGPWFRGPAGLQMARGAVGDRAHRAHVIASRDHFIDTHASARAGFLVGMSRMDLRPGHGHIEVPTKVVVGTQDRLTPLRMAKVLARGIADSELVVLPGAGHMLPLERPQEVAEVIAGLTVIGTTDAAPGS